MNRLPNPPTPYTHISSGRRRRSCRAETPSVGTASSDLSGRRTPTPNPLEPEPPVRRTNLKVCPYVLSLTLYTHISSGRRRRSYPRFACRDSVFRPVRSAQPTPNPPLVRTFGSADRPEGMSLRSSIRKSRIVRF
jgi:hypothetical protein